MVLLPSFLLFISSYYFFIIISFELYLFLFLLLFFFSAGILYQSIFAIATTLVEHKLHEFFRTKLVEQVEVAKLLIQSPLIKIKCKSPT